MIGSIRPPAPHRIARWLGVALSLAVLVAVTPLAAAPPGRILSDAEWRTDLAQVVEALDEIHPDPYRTMDESDEFGAEMKTELEAAAVALRAAIPASTDREIVVALAELVALLDDGHTRLFLPRQHRELAPELEAGHSGTEPPARAELALAQLPVRFGLFSDGLFVTRTAPAHSEFVGLRVVRIGRFSTEEALEKAAATIAAGNDSRRRILLPDRMALPDLLAAAGITDSPDSTELFLADRDGEERAVTLEPLPVEPARWTGGPSVVPLWLLHPSRSAWYEVLTDRSAVFVQVDELEAFPERPWADFVRETLEAARAAGAERYILDLRHNAGGDGTWVTPFLTGLIGTEFDRYGRLMVLIGGHTFSAAQTLVNRLERMTEACFVGEPSGAPPTHFGDSKKIRLEASGLTLRVSTRYWPNSSNDFRRATAAHVDAMPTAADYFAGRDPVLEAALTYEPPQTTAEQVEDLLRRGKTQAGIFRFVRDLLDPRVEHRSLEAMVAAGHRLLDDDLATQGRIVFLLTAEYYEASAEAEAGWGRALELMDDVEGARRHYEKALEIDPDSRSARQALARLAEAS